MASSVKQKRVETRPWVYLSPHLDDVALSVGGLVWTQCTTGTAVEVWTICAGDVPSGPLSPFAQSLHERWGTGRDAVARRRAEDENACRILGARPVYLDIPDCIYRRAASGEPFYPQGGDIFGDLHPGERALVEHLADLLAARLPANAVLVVPLTLGGHVDHQLTRAAAERLGGPLWYYADYPYVLWQTEDFSAGLSAQVFPLSPEAVTAWQNAVAAYRSQLSTFWADEIEMRAAIAAYARQQGGVALYRMEHSF
ncbi:MAG: PIG-L family deacetylase [Anaerolineae bacterium]|nr:MAG: PIG-L family deacetylase [Anaerolineae bacterium]